MPKQEPDEERENRIEMEIVADAHDETERAMGWFSYLEEELKCPFTAECIKVLRQSPLRRGEQVEVLGLAEGDVCEHDMLVTVKFRGRKLAVPLAQLQPLTKEESTCRAVADWHYWVNQGYEF
jgi:hypothetical protein